MKLNFLLIKIRPPDVKSQSFQRKGNRITASNMIRASRATSMSTVLIGMLRRGENAAPDKRINRISWGIMIGNPSTAMIAAFCCALAAIAARKLNTRLRLHPPNKTRPTNGPAFRMGLPRNIVKSSRLSRLMIIMSSELKSSLDNTKAVGLAME